MAFGVTLRISEDSLHSHVHDGQNSKKWAPGLPDEVHPKSDPKPELGPKFRSESGFVLGDPDQKPLPAKTGDPDPL